jgi:membrane protease YdiL (CAAX protease family)
VIATAVFFSAMHFLIEPPDIYRFFYRFAFGLATGLLFLRQGALAGIIGLHTGWNFVALSFSDSEWRSGGLLMVSGLRDHSEVVANIVLLFVLSGAIYLWNRKHPSKITPLDIITVSL